MGPWLELVVRETALLVLLAAVGAGAVVLLPATVDRATRWALAPAYGLAIAACVFTTTILRVPAHKSAWLLVVLVLASLAFAAWRSGTGTSLRTMASSIHPPVRDTLQIGAIILVVLFAFNAPLAARDSTGPIGGYRVADTVGYINEIDGMRVESLHGASLQKPPWRDLSLEYWVGIAGHDQELGSDTVVANAAVLLGLRTTALYSPYVIILILVGALAAFAAVRQVTGTRSWWAISAGLLFAGPFFHTLLMDGSIGAISGLVLVVPTLAAGWLAVDGGRWMDCVLCGLMLAGLQTMYPLFIPHIAILAAAVLLVLLVMRAYRRALTSMIVRAAVLRLGLVVVLAAALTPVAFERNLRFWASILKGSFSFVGLPVYDLPVGVVPGWLAQTRVFYDLPHLSTLAFSGVVSSIVLPLALIAVIIAGILRHRVTAASLLIVAAAAALAYKTSSGEHCSYCTQRNLLVASPVLMVLVGIGLVALAGRGRAVRTGAAGIAILAAIVIAGKTVITADQQQDGAYALDHQVNDVVAHLPTDSPVQMEGFGQGSLAPMEEPLVYERINEQTPQQVSIYAATDDASGLEYLGGTRPIGVEFLPDYRYVITRFSSIRTDRRTLRRSGPIALQERTGPYDVLLTGGPSVAFAWQDERGYAWVRPSVPLRFYIVGDAPGPVPSVRLTLNATVPVQVAGAAATHRVGHQLTVCFPAGGFAPVRAAELSFGFAAVPPPPSSKYAIPEPARGLRLTSMSASTKACGAGHMTG